MFKDFNFKAVFESNLDKETGKEKAEKELNRFIEVKSNESFISCDNQASLDMARNILGMDYWLEQYSSIKIESGLNVKDLEQKIIDSVAASYSGDINISFRNSLYENLLPLITEEDKKEKIKNLIDSYKFEQGEPHKEPISNKIDLLECNAKFNFEKRETLVKKITLIFPPSSVNGVGLENCMIPNGLLSIGSYIKEKMPHIELEVLDGSILSLEDIIKKIKEINPSLVGVSMLAGNSASASEILTVAKEIGATTVAGNHHAKYLQDQLKDGLIDGVDNLDYLIEGRRGEFSFTDLIESINNDGEGIKEIKSLVCSQKGNLLFNEERLEKDYPKMPELSDPDLSLISNFEPYFDVYNKVFAKFHPGEYIKQVNVNYIKGCFQGMKKPCSYCCLKDHKFDFLEPKDYWKKISALSEKGFNMVFETCNSLTSLDKLKKGGNGESYLKRLAESMPEELKDKMKMFVYGRVDEINDETISYLKKLNVCRIVFGFDSGSKTLSSGIGKMNISPNQNLEVAKKLDEAGIQIYGCYVAGAKGESKETIEETEKQIIEIMNLKNTAAIEYTSLAPMPGSLSWNFVKDDYHEKYGSVINVENLSRLWLEKLRESGDVDVDWNDIEESKQRLRAEADKRGVVFGGYY